MQTEQTGLSLEINNIGITFGEHAVLRSVNLSICSGEFIAIVGRSGCGKSTLLKMISGLQPPTSGEVLADGDKITGIHPHIRFLFQEPRLLPWKKVLDNVRLGAAGNDAQAALAALAAVGLADRTGDWPYVLSGGQKQRVALARALVGKPRLLLLDEPMGALDALTRIEMQQLIENIWLERGFTGILVTHDVAEAVKLADRVLLIEDNAITMDLQISLTRPRTENNDFVYFERHILDRVLKTGATLAKKTHFEI